MKQHPLEINMIADNNGTSWYYSKGHHEPAAFLAAARGYIAEEDPYQEQPDDDIKVHTSHGRRYKDFTGEFGYRVDLDCAPGRGAFPVTWIEL